LRDLLRQKAVAVLREARRVEHGFVDPEPDKPAKQQVELQPLDKLPRRADRRQQLQQCRPQEPFWSDRRNARPTRKASRTPVEPIERRIRQPPHRPKRMARRNTRLDINIAKQRPDRPIFSGLSRLSNPIQFVDVPKTESPQRAKNQRLFQQPAKRDFQFAEQNWTGSPQFSLNSGGHAAPSCLLAGAKRT
jgi:hypothetical protein